MNHLRTIGAFCGRRALLAGAVLAAAVSPEPAAAQSLRGDAVAAVTENGDSIPEEGERESRFALSIHLGKARSETRTLESSVSRGVGLEYGLRPRLSALLAVGFDQLKDFGLGTDLELFYLSLLGRYYLRSAVPLLPFLEGGLGVYDVSPGDSELGASLGLGLRWDFAPDLSLEVSYRHHEVEFPGPRNLEFATAQLGLRWKP